MPAHILGVAGLAVLAVAPSLWWLAGFICANLWFSGLGMSVGFHRYFTHRAFTTNRFWAHVMLLGGTLAAQGSVIFWVALHRLHHPASDTASDVHTPLRGFWHAYVGWIVTLPPNQVSLSRAADLVKDRACRWTHRHYVRILWTWWLILAATTVVAPATLPFIGGMLFAGVWSIHQEALINSVCHMRKVGYRNYETADDSTNIAWLAWLTWGQALHNNHHADPKRKTFAHVRGEVDPGAALIAVLETAHQGPRPQRAVAQSLPDQSPNPRSKGDVHGSIDA